MSAFLTGSRVYGTPREDSDFDMVVLMTVADLYAAMQHLHGEVVHDYSFSAGSLRFGDLNLIIQTDPKLFAAWQKARDTLTAIKPVTREVAVAVHKQCFAEAEPPAEPLLC